MDQIDNHLNTNIYQQIPSLLNYQYPSNSLFLDHCFPTATDESTSSPIIENEQDENEQMPMPIVYKKRVRTKFTPEQLDVLEATFQIHRYPSVDVVDNLVEQLDLPTQKITIWFQNRRARLKKTQQKLDIQHSYEKEDQQQYDSGIHLDEEASHDSPASPPLNTLFNIVPPPIPTSFMPTSNAAAPPPPPPPAPYYLPNSHYAFYNSMWPNFGYSLPSPSFPPPMPNATPHPYNLISYNSSDMPSSFIFQDLSNHSFQKEFNGEL